MNGPRFKMFGDYLDYLQKCVGLPLYSMSKKLELFQAYVNGVNSKWIDICDPQISKEPLGFLIVGYPPNCHPNADFYIEEAYIRPEYQKQGRMSAAASDFIQSNPGTYCLFVVRGNEPAYLFWKKVFARNNYTPCYLSDVGAADETCTQYGFRRSRQK